MSKILYWIDDTHDVGKPPSPAEQKRLEKGLGVTLSIQQIQERKQFDGFLAQLAGDKGKNVAGVIMDYQLTKVGENGLWAFGNTWAAEVRAVAASIPVIGISHEPEKQIPRLRLKSFLAFFPRDVLMGLQPPFQNVSALLEGYAETYRTFETQKEDKPPGAELMIGLIKPPKAVRDLVGAAIPTELTGHWDKETPHVAGRWLWHDLQGRPGPLLDDLALATHLGLNLHALRLIHRKFEGARYTSAFASGQRARWWVAPVRELVEKIIGQKIFGPVSNARGDLLKALRVKKHDRPKMLARAHPNQSLDLIPDCVAYSDDEREEKDRIQALFKDTRVDPKDENPPFGFEPRRIFEPAPRQ
jgi:hypothetical protein